MTALIDLLEYNYQDLLKGVDNARLQRAKDRPTKFAGLVNKNELRFVTRGSDGNKYTNKVRLVDLEDSMQFIDLTLRDRVSLAMKGDLHVSCDCPDFLFSGRKYIATQMGFAFPEDPENRFPTVKNPNLDGTLCKHLITVMQVLPFHTGSVVKEIKTKKYYQDLIPKKD